MSVFTTMAMDAMLFPFAPATTEEHEKWNLPTTSLRYAGKVRRKGLKRRISSYWKVKPSGDFANDLIVGRNYAVEVLSMARAKAYPFIINRVLDDLAKDGKNSGIETGFLQVIADCALFGTMAFQSQRHGQDNRVIGRAAWNMRGEARQPEEVKP